MSDCRHFFTMRLIFTFTTAKLWLFLIFTVVFVIDIKFVCGRKDAIRTDSLNISYTDNTIEQSKLFYETLNGNGSISNINSQPVSNLTATKIPLVTLIESLSQDTSLYNETDSCKCGLASFASGKIVGGSTVNEPHFWPWFAAVVRNENHFNKVHCGASLISRRYVLTAAHCLIPMIQTGVKHFKLKFGTNELYEASKNDTDVHEGFSEDKIEVPIESVSIHPQFEQAYPYHFDIGVIKLAYGVNCSRHIRPICLPPHGEFHEAYSEMNKAVTVGFGRTSLNGNHSRLLQQIELDLVPLKECRESYKQLPFKAPDILDSMICAFSKGKDSCVGDSGGPLFLWRMTNSSMTSLGKHEKPKYFEQVGITSYGIGCANDMFPGIYSRVSKFVPWLKSMIDHDISW